MVKKFSLVLILLLIVFPAAFAAAQVDLVGGIGGNGCHVQCESWPLCRSRSECDSYAQRISIACAFCRIHVQNARQGFRSGCRSRASCQRDRLRRRTFRSILERESGLLHDRAGVPAWRCRGEDGFPPVRRKDEQRYVLGDAYRSVLLSRLLLLRSLRPVCPMAMQSFVSAVDISE